MKPATMDFRNLISLEMNRRNCSAYRLCEECRGRRPHGMDIPYSTIRNFLTGKSKTINSDDLGIIFTVLQINVSPSLSVPRVYKYMRQHTSPLPVHRYHELPSNATPDDYDDANRDPRTGRPYKQTVPMYFEDSPPAKPSTKTKTLNDGLETPADRCAEINRTYHPSQLNRNTELGRAMSQINEKWTKKIHIEPEADK